VQYVSMNESREWKLSDLVKVPSGRDAWIPDATSVSSIQSDGTANYVDEGTIRFQGALDYRGPASVTFTVTDGASKDDPKGNTVQLTLPIVVGDPEFRDTPPTFTTPSLQVEVGETTTFDLRAATGHPNATILQQVTYSELTGTSTRLTGAISGSTLEISTPRNTPKGTTFTLGVTLRWDKFTVPGTIEVTVVGSTRAPALAVADSYETQRGDGAVVASPLVNDSNPYASTGEPLTIVGAKVQNSGEPAGVTFTADTVRITPNPSLKSGTIVVVYTIQDATEDPDREVSGTITVVVSDVPDQPQKPTVPSQGDEGTVQIGFQAPASNGKEITSYEVRSTPSVATPTNCAPPSCTITGLTNGTSYQFSVRAVNVHGPGEWSVLSNAVIPYGTPGTPDVAITTVDQWAPNAVIRGTWSGVSANGGSVSYEYQLDNGAWQSVTATNTGDLTVGAGSHTITVRAVNSGGKKGATDSANTSITAQGTPGAVSISGGVSGKTVNWSWSGGSASPGGMANVQYRYNINGGGWSGWSATTTASRTGAGTYSIQVQARNKAAESAVASNGPHTIVQDPSATVVSKSAQSVPTCTSGCYAANVRLNDITAGSYTVTMEWSNGQLSNTATAHVSSGGTIRTSGVQGVLVEGSSLRVRVVGPSGTFYTPWYNRDQWNGVPIS
jgi:hypothetical protein